METSQISPRFVKDKDGNTTGVYLSVEDFNKVLEMMEDLADIEDFDEAMKEPDDSIPLEEFKRQLAEEK